MLVTKTHKVLSNEITNTPAKYEFEWWLFPSNAIHNAHIADYNMQ